MLRLAACCALGALAFAPAAFAQSAETSQTTTLRVMGTGEVRVQPDIAVMNLGVVTEAPTAQGAIQENAARMTAVLEALRKAGARANEIQTSGLNLDQRYRYVANQPPERTGYSASNAVTVTVRDLGKVGSLLDAAITAGATQVRSFAFRATDTKAAQNQARESAVKDLQAKADLYARASGYRVVRLVNLAEGGSTFAPPPPPPPPPPLPVPPVAHAQTPTSPGEITVRETVSAVFELAR